MNSQTICSSFSASSKPYIAMISLQFGYAGMNIITKISLNGGMSHYVLVVYRHAFATAVIAPFAFFFERKAQPRINFRVYVQIFFLGLLGPVIDQNLYYAGLRLTSPTFSCAMSNMLPAMTFIMAIIFRMEKVDLKKAIHRVKVVGTIIALAGAMLMTLYKGPLMEMPWSKHRQPHHSSTTTDTETSNRDWLIGCILLIIATLSWASFFILQKAALKTYSNHQLSLTSMVCFVGTLQAVVVTLIVERKATLWRIGWDMNLLAAAYAGIVTSSISYYVQGLVMKCKGPVFATAFSPLMMVIVAVMGSFILAEKIYLGGVVGAVIIVVGLYSVLWGKYKEEHQEETQEIPHQLMAIKNSTQVINGNLQVVIANNTTTNGSHEMPTTEADKHCPPIATDLPLSKAPTKPT